MRATRAIKNLIAIAIILLPIGVTAQTLTDAQKAYNSGITAKDEGNLEEAINQFTVCVEACEYLVEEEEDETAEELLYSVQSVIPKLYLQLGTNQLQQQKIKEGITTLKKTKEVAGNYGDNETVDKVNNIIPQVYYKLGAGKLKANDLDGAIVELDKAIEANNNYGPAFYLKTFVYKKKGDNELFKSTALAGIQACKSSKDTKTEKKIVDLGKKHFLKLGNDSKGASKYEEAVSYLNSSIEFDPSDPVTLYLLAQTYSSLKKYDEAIETGNRAVEAETGSDEDKAKIYMVIAEAQTAKGDKASACETYKKAAVGQYAELANYRIKHELKCGE